MVGRQGELWPCSRFHMAWGFWSRPRSHCVRWGRVSLKWKLYSIHFSTDFCFRSVPTSSNVFDRLLYNYIMIRLHRVDDWFVVNSRSKDHVAEPTHWSVAGASDDPWVHDHGVPAGGQLLGEGRPNNHQLKQAQDRSLQRKRTWTDAQFEVEIVRSSQAAIVKHRSHRTRRVASTRGAATRVNATENQTNLISTWRYATRPVCTLTIFNTTLIASHTMWTRLYSCIV